MKVATLEKFHLREGIKILGTPGWEKLGEGGRGGRIFFPSNRGGTDFGWHYGLLSSKEFLTGPYLKGSTIYLEAGGEVLTCSYLILLLNDANSEKLCFIQFSTRMAGWLRLTFLICLHNKLSSIIHTFHVLRVQMFEKCDSSKRQ